MSASNSSNQIALAHVRYLLAGGYFPQALKAALAAAARRGVPVLDARGRPSSESFLRALQAATKELEGIGAALAAGEGEQAEKE